MLQQYHPISFESQCLKEKIGSLFLSMTSKNKRQLVRSQNLKMVSQSKNIPVLLYITSFVVLLCVVEPIADKLTKELSETQKHLNNVLSMMQPMCSTACLKTISYAYECTPRDTICRDACHKLCSDPIAVYNNFAGFWNGPKNATIELKMIGKF